MDYSTIVKNIAGRQNDEEWKKSHNSVNLAVSVVTGAANLLESFKWTGAENPGEVIDSRKSEIVDKVADIVTQLIYLCHNLGIEQDSLEAFIYSKIIKEYNLSHPQETSKNNKTIDFKNLSKVLIISFISSGVFYKLFPFLSEVVQLA
jgi:hypothetical protein